MSKKTATPMYAAIGPLSFIEQWEVMCNRKEHDLQQLRNEKDRLKNEKERLKKRIEIGKIFKKWRESHPGESDKFVDMKIEKGFVWIDAMEDEAELQQHVIRLQQHMIRLNTTDPDVIAAFDLAMKIAEKYTAMALKDTDESIRKMVLRHNGGDTTKENAKKKRELLRAAAKKRWKKKPSFSVNAIAKYLLDEGGFAGKLRNTSEIIKDLKPSK